MTAAAEMPDDILKAAFSTAGAVQGTSMPSVRAVSAIAQAILAERQNADRYKLMFEDAVRQHNEQMARAEAAEAGRDHWQNISTAPKDGTRIILMWEPFGGVSEHVELGRWSERNGWVNTYGHAFTGYPTHWMPIHAAPKGGA